MPKLFVLLALVAGCANIHVNRAALVVSTLALACDAAQTMRAAGHWQPDQMEANPVMGEHPDQMMVAGYFAGTIIANTIVWLGMPERYRSVIPAGVIGVQANAIAGNTRMGLGVCGI